ncbi:hypothetical protein AV530_018514 [Patagioenas fasciata monilis]|uniref:Uncharacterized protein n=1 Tax=Patagioenas fasciata monilis TaxID=372326 RepID=A0A1V4JS83_PATFA|nr:hypothetical protein AV530_018514 [Patagioenas fasciata monilis]
MVLWSWSGCSQGSIHKPWIPLQSHLVKFCDADSCCTSKSNENHDNGESEPMCTSQNIAKEQQIQGRLISAPAPFQFFLSYLDIYFCRNKADALTLP